MTMSENNVIQPPYLQPTKTPFWKNPKFLLIVGVVLTLVALVLLFLKPAKKEEAPEAIPRPSIPAPPPFQAQAEATQAAKTKNLKVTFSGQEPELPASLKIYQVTEGSQSIPEEEIYPMASRLGFTSAPSVAEDIKYGTFYFWSGENGDLAIKPGLREILYSVWEWEKSAPGGSVGSYEAAAEEFLRQSGLGSEDLVLNGDKTTYLKLFGPQWREVDSSSKAVLVQVGFDYLLDGIPLVGHFFGENPVYLNLDSSGQVVRMNYILFDPSRLVALEEYPIKSFKEALEELNTDSNFIVNVENTLLGFNELEDQGGKLSGNLTQVYLAYFQPSEEVSTLQPFFVFKGTGTVGEGGGAFTIYLPAVK